MNARARDGDSPVRWVPIAGLTELSRALLGERSGDRDVVPAHVAERVTTLAEQWAGHGFTPETVRPWIDIGPADAAVLSARGVTPAALEQQVATIRGVEVTLWQALTSGLLSGAEAVERLAAAGGPEPVAPSEPVAPPALFSHPATEPAAETTTGRPKPSHAPFRT